MRLLLRGGVYPLGRHDDLIYLCLMLSRLSWQVCIQSTSINTLLQRVGYFVSTQCNLLGEPVASPRV